MPEITKGKAKMRFFWDNEAYRCEEDKIVMLQVWALNAHSNYLREFVAIGDIKNQLEEVKLRPASTRLGDKGEVVEQTYNERSYRLYYLDIEEVKQAVREREKSAEQARLYWQKTVQRLREAKRKYRRVRSLTKGGGHVSSGMQAKRRKA